MGASVMRLASNRTPRGNAADIGALTMIERIELFEHDDYLWAMVDDVDGISVDMIRLQHVDEDGAEG